MDKTQATEIETHLRVAVDALHRAGDTIQALDETDRRSLADALADIVAPYTSNSGKYYKRYPDLEPPGEVPMISSTLRRNDVASAGRISEADLDALIFSVMSTQYRKVAMVIGTTLKQRRKLGWPISDEMIGARIQELDETDRLESQGDFVMAFREALP